MNLDAEYVFQVNKHKVPQNDQKYHLNRTTKSLNKKLDDPLRETNPNLQSLQSENLNNTENPPQQDFQNKKKKRK
jgi:hypothetical protein